MKKSELKSLIKEQISAMGYNWLSVGQPRRVVREVVADKQIWKNLVESLSDLAQVFENYSVGEIIGDLKGKELKISDIQKLDRMVTDVTNYIS